MWVLVVEELHPYGDGDYVSGVVGPFETKGKAEAAQQLLKEDGEYCTVHEVKPL